ncbi:MAG: hypothetical protein ACE5MG_10010 [Candidatus Methylomirabilales bacterium]
MRHLTGVAITKLLVVTTLAGVLGLISGVAMALEGNIEDDAQDYVGRIIVITDPRPSVGFYFQPAKTTSGLFCATGYNVYRALVINPGGGPAIVTEVGIEPDDLRPGDRFDVTFQERCNGRLRLILTPK